MPGSKRKNVHTSSPVNNRQWTRKLADLEESPVKRSSGHKVARDSDDDGVYILQLLFTFTNLKLNVLKFLKLFF